MNEEKMLELVTKIIESGGEAVNVIIAWKKMEILQNSINGGTAICIVLIIAILAYSIGSNYGTGKWK